MMIAVFFPFHPQNLDGSCLLLLVLIFQLKLRMQQIDTEDILVSKADVLVGKTDVLVDKTDVLVGKTDVLVGTWWDILVNTPDIYWWEKVFILVGTLE